MYYYIEYHIEYCYTMYYVHDCYGMINILLY